MTSSVSGKSVVAEEDNAWEMEDPNLLNNPELLYRAVEKLPLPNNHGEEFLEFATIAREVILQGQKNFIENLRKREGILTKQEDSVEVITNFLGVYNDMGQKCLDTVSEFNKMEIWTDDIKNKVLSERSAEQILRWKHVLSSFLEGYNKIRHFISEEGVLNDQANAEAIEHEKQQLNKLPQVLEEMQECLDAVKILSGE